MQQGPRHFSSIAIPPATKSLEMKPAFLSLINTHQFTRMDHEDPYTHLGRFFLHHIICDWHPTCTCKTTIIPLIIEIKLKLTAPSKTVKIWFLDIYIHNCVIMFQIYISRIIVLDNYVRKNILLDLFWIKKNPKCAPANPFNFFFESHVPLPTHGTHS